jgi:Glycosyl hydrolase family 76
VRRLAFVSILCLGLLLPAIAAAPGGADPTVDAKRAVASYNAMQRYLFDSRTGRYREAAGAKTPARAWPSSQALSATIAVAALPSRQAAADVAARFRSLDRVFGAGALYAAWPGGDVYLDDNAWIAGAWLDWSQLAAGAPAQARAAALFAKIVKAWDPNAAHPCAGGVFWTTADANRDRNTVTTANAALLGLRLYQVTQSPGYLAWSRRLLTWVDHCMLGPDGLYWDHIALNGAVDESYWSYNQGLVIGALVQLYAINGDPATLARAETLGDAALAYFADRWDGDEPPEFAVIFFRHLLELAAVAGRPDYVAAAESYADQAWSASRSASTGLFAFSGHTRLLDQAALVQLYATLARQPVTAAPSVQQVVVPAPS